ncbi:hypothetical protein [Dysgonomonas mossii]|uniref:hypothetical protein n=1 Tax=Dysgonomonas mossii TaxID=163665 RepID=UPI0039937DFE
MRKIGVIFCLCLLFCNCDSRSPLIKDEKTLRSLIDKALNENDEFAYSEVRAHYFSEERLQDFCYYAIKMANKYDYPDAYYDVFVTLTLTENKPIDSLDNKTKCLALYYLLKAKELGSERGKYDIQKIFPDSIPNSTYYLEEMSKE